MSSCNAYVEWIQGRQRLRFRRNNLERDTAQNRGHDTRHARPIQSIIIGENTSFFPPPPENAVVTRPLRSFDLLLAVANRIWAVLLEASWARDGLSGWISVCEVTTCLSAEVTKYSGHGYDVETFLSPLLTPAEIKQYNGHGYDVDTFLSPLLTPTGPILSPPPAYPHETCCCRRDHE
ncbi:hypothetical protein V500_05586 [Pseudogymnoascus sp. VKM F-4518 (FW-2643)]|nr:hypothetical protein V500_05586 [Pseudogymnoascus sp. VKM F-4518 (FW-2643)]